MIIVQLEGWHDEFLNPLNEVTMILLETLQELLLEVLLGNQVLLELLLGELLHRCHDDVVGVDLGGIHLL